MSPNESRILNRAIHWLAKGRMGAGHAAVIADLQGLHDHPDTHEHVRAAIAPLLAKHGPKPKPVKAPKPAARSDESHAAARKVNDHVVRLKHMTGDARFDAIHAEVAGHPTAHVHAVAKALTGSVGRTKKQSLQHIRRAHDMLVHARAREASQDGRTAA